MYLHRDARPHVEELDALPTLNEGYTADLKWENGDDLRFWVHRTTLADGEPFERTVTVETYDGQRWTDHAVYDGENPDES